MIIAIDGNHHVGKSTIIEKLAKYYQNNNHIVFYKFPSYTKLGDFARQSVGEEPDDVQSLLFVADYYSFFNNILFNHHDKILILDRYILTLFVFQGYLKNKDYAFLNNLCKKLPMPDVQIVITKKSNSETKDTSKDPFVSIFKDMDFCQRDRVFVVENIINYQCEDNTGFETVKKIINNTIDTNNSIFDD